MLSSDLTNLENDQTSFKVLIQNKGVTIAQLYTYHWKISLQEEKGNGSKLEYQDALQQKHVEAYIEQSLSHFFQQPTLKILYCT